MKLKAIALLYFLFVFTICMAQSTPDSKLNALSFELGKSGLIYNINFDHKFQNKNFGFRAGIGSNLSKYLGAFTTGAGGYYLTGKANNFLELGVDLNYLSVTENSDDQRGIPLIYPDYPIKTFYASADIGYRRYGTKTLFRIGFAPGFIKNNFVPGGYISYGLIF